MAQQDTNDETHHEAASIRGASGDATSRPRGETAPRRGREAVPHGMDEEHVTRLRRAVGKLSRELNSSATSEGLTPTQASVLGLVVSRGPIGVAALIELEHINPTMLSRVLGKLEKSGLVERATDPTDQRSVRITATGDGTQASHRVRQQRTALVFACIEPLPAEQADSLTRAIPALEALAQQLTQR